jgi:hypothetical protein
MPMKDNIFVTTAPMKRAQNWPSYLRERREVAERSGLWCCPKCGIIGRLAHRHMSESELRDPSDPGECNLGYILSLKGYIGYFDGDGI